MGTPVSRGSGGAGFGGGGGFGIEGVGVGRGGEGGPRVAEMSSRANTGVLGVVRWRRRVGAWAVRVGVAGLGGHWDWCRVWA